MNEINSLKVLLNNFVRDRYPQIKEVEVYKSDPDPIHYFNYYTIYLILSYSDLSELSDSQLAELKRYTKRLFHMIVPDSVYNNLQVVTADKD